MSRFQRLGTYGVAAALLAGVLTTGDARAAQRDVSQPRQHSVGRARDDRPDRERLLRWVLRFAIKQLSNDPIMPRP